MRVRFVGALLSKLTCILASFVPSFALISITFRQDNLNEFRSDFVLVLGILMPLYLVFFTRLIEVHTPIYSGTFWYLVLVISMYLSQFQGCRKDSRKRTQGFHSGTIFLRTGFVQHSVEPALKRVKLHESINVGVFGVC